jgi:16S rRNA (uracil1498-N3)-methyltransferase
MQRYFALNKEKEKFILSSKDMHHIKNVMRFKVGTIIEVVYEEKLYLAVVNNEIVEKELLKENKKKPLIYLGIPLVKEQKMDYILQKATELGVSHIIPLMLERCLIKIKDDEKKVLRWNLIAKEASEQAKRLDVPIIHKPIKLKDITFDGLKIFCSTNMNEISLKKFLQNHQTYDKLLIVIGPEGGLTAKEEEYLLKNSYIPITLGENILRVETVPLYVLSALNYERLDGDL